MSSQQPSYYGWGPPAALPPVKKTKKEQQQPQYIDILNVRKTLADSAKMPTKITLKSAGFILYSAVDTVVIPPKGGKALINTGLVIQVPKGTYGRVAPLMELAQRHFIGVGGGVIDENYKGVVVVFLLNFGDNPFHVMKGDRIAQLICERIVHPILQESKCLGTTTTTDQEEQSPIKDPSSVAGGNSEEK